MSIIQGTAKSGGSTDFYDYPIEQSLRLNNNDSSYLQRTNATDGDDPKKFTLSSWVKMGDLSVSYFPIIGSATGTSAFFFIGFSSNQISFRNRNSSSTDTTRIVSNSVYRDPSGWYHVVAVWDTANATSTERVKLYVNGEQVTSFEYSNYPSLDDTPHGDFEIDMQIGRTNIASSTFVYGDGYLANIQFIDGQALDASYFGETKDDIWVPKAYTGSYGTNGFHLDFADSSNIGNDVSGNNNDWTVN